MQEQREWRRGVHQARFEPPDTLWVKYQGSISHQDFIWIVELCRELGSHRAFFLVSDLKESTTLDPEGRRYASEHIDSAWLAGVIYLRARLLHRAAARGISLVQHMLGRESPPVYFVSTEEEARQAIERERRS